MTQPPEPPREFLRRGQPAPPEFTSRAAAPPPPLRPAAMTPPAARPSNVLSPPVVGMLAALLLGVAWAAGGFEGFGIALLLGALGFVVAGQLAGRFDVRDCLRRSRD